MRIKETCAKLLTEMEDDLEATCQQVTDPLDKLATCLKRVGEGVSKLKATVLAVPTLDQATEIFVFKELKPAFSCYQTYFTELYTIETGMPFCDVTKQIEFLEGELGYGERFRRQHKFLHAYYQFKMSEMDHVYFLRSAASEGVLLPHGPDRDPEFSTACDYLFGKFRAFDMLREWIQEKIAYLKGGKPLFSLDAQDADELRWTGDIINAAELGYGLYLSGQLNHGQASIAQIFRWLETRLNINIGVPAKKFAEIRARKRLSRTKFTDEMRDALLHKMDKDDAPAEKVTLWK